MAGEGTHGSAVWDCGYASKYSHHRVRQVNSQLRRRWLGRVDVTCDKFDNRLYILKTGYRLETGLPAYRLLDSIRSRNSAGNCGPMQVYTVSSFLSGRHTGVRSWVRLLYFTQNLNV